MNPLFQNQADANTKCNEALEKAWKEFTSANNISIEVNKDAYELTKKVFNIGFTYGVTLISEEVLKYITKTKEIPNEKETPKV